MSGASAIYAGAVLHRRRRPRTHFLKHACFWLYIDIDELENLDRRLKLFSIGRFNLMSFRASDFGDASATPLREQAQTILERAGVRTGRGKIMLLCMPRVLGYGFNPLSVWFCNDEDGSLKALIYEVHNTFGERHSYVIPVTGDSVSVRQSCNKNFHVSPFMDMGLVYDFAVTGPSERMSVAIRTSDRKGVVLNAVMAGQRLDLTDATLLKLSFKNPFLTLKVIAAIHAHALVLWWKGIGVRAHKGAPFYTAEIVRPVSPQNQAAAE